MLELQKDLKSRKDCHRNGTRAVFTKKYNATNLIYLDDFHDAFASKKQLKNWHNEWKWNLVKVSNPELKDLYLEL